MYLNIIKTPKGSITAICDKELINKTLKEGEIILNIKKYSNFYKGKLVGDKEITKAIKEAEHLNLVGKKCIEIAKKINKINDKQILYIEGIPHVQIYKLYF
ncbi:MAG: DUF424 family protein [Candidatus Micrarchaeia archaeon]|jgi:hypothetical protein